MRAMPKRSLCQQSVDTGVRLSFFITHIQTQIQIQIQIQILCVNKALTPSCPLSFFFSDASFPISPSFQLLAAVASQIRKLSPLNVSWDFWGQVQPMSFLDSSKPLVTMFRSPDKSSWQEKLDPLLFPHSLNLLDRSPGRNFPFLHLLQEFRGLNSFNKRTEGSGKQLLCEFPSFMKVFSEILDTSCVELNECQAAHQHKESLL